LPDGPPSPWEGFEAFGYVSAGLARLFDRHRVGEAREEWAALCGGEFWPDARAGFFVDLGVGLVGEIGGATPTGTTNSLTARLLAGWAF
jgi:hypothetical protein